MKNIWFLIILLLTTLSISAQTLNAPLKILQNNWRLVVSRHNPALDADPFKALDDTRKLQQARIDNISQNESNAKLGLPLNAPPGQVNSAANPAYLNIRSNSYVYDLVVKNTSQKKIKSVSWDYVFFDFDGKTEVGHNHFMSNSKIKAGETRKLTGKSGSPPANIVNIAIMGKALNNQYPEKIIIRKIIYTDGSIWTLPSN